MITINFDPQPDSHTVAALEDNGTTVASLTVSNGAEGMALLHRFAFLPKCRWAVEGAGNRYILPFVSELLERGEVVHHIPPNLTSQYRSRVSQKKNDVVDADNAARALQANSGLPTFQLGEHQREL